MEDRDGEAEGTGGEVTDPRFSLSPVLLLYI